MSLLLVIFVNQAFTVKFSRTLYLTTCRNVQKEKKKIRSTIHRTRVLHECVLVISLLLLLLSLLCRGCQVKAYTH